MISLMFPTRARSSLARGEKGCRLLEDLLEIMRVVCSQPALFMRFLRLRELESCSEVRWRYHCGCVKMTGCASQRVQKDLIITVGGRACKTLQGTQVKTSCEEMIKVLFLICARERTCTIGKSKSRYNS